MPSGVPLPVFLSLQLGGLALFVSLAVAGFARLGGLGDVPDARSSHARTTPTGGGLGVLAGVGAAVLAAVIFHAEAVFAQPGTAAKLASLLASAFAVGVIGLVDDRFVVPTGLKFGLIGLICLYAVVSIGAVNMLPFADDHIYLLWWSALIGTVLWMFVTVNAVNFIDGINGLMAGAMALASGTLALVALRTGAPATALLSGALATALCGLLPYNLRRRAAVFSGDVGSLPTGLLYAGAVLMLVHEQPEMRLLYAGPLLILPVLADVLLTLLLKPARGLALTAPHATHIYQRAARAVGSHVTVSAVYIGLVGLLALLVNHALGRGTLGSVSGLFMLSGLMACAYAVAHLNLPD